VREAQIAQRGEKDPGRVCIRSSPIVGFALLIYGYGLARQAPV